MKNLSILLIILFCIASLQVHAQTKYTINFTPSHLTVNEDTGSINITASIHPAAKTASGIDVNFVPSHDGDYQLPPVTTLDFEPGDSVASIRLKIIDTKSANNVRIHAFTLDDFMHTFIKGPDSIFTLTIIDNDSVVDAAIKPTLPGSLNSEIRIYPNPAKGTIKISTAQLISGKLNIGLFDMEGRNLGTYYFENQRNNVMSITLPENVKGLLLLRFENEGNVSYKKILVE